jgi:hypothetical protein
MIDQQRAQKWRSSLPILENRAIVEKAGAVEEENWGCWSPRYHAVQNRRRVRKYGVFVLLFFLGYSFLSSEHLVSEVADQSWFAYLDYSDRIQAYRSE